MMRASKLFGSLVFLALSTLSGSLVAAPLTAGSVITLTDSYGSTGGGEFIANTVPAVAADSFITFCLEKNETFTPGQNLYVKGVTNYAESGGVAGATDGKDPISYQTAYLYTQFRAGTLSNYDYSDTGSARIADANSLQRAFWVLENEKSSTSDLQAQAWIGEANAAVVGSWGTTIGDVRVLNLFQDAEYTIAAQDQLYLLPSVPEYSVTAVPEPEIYAMLGIGLGLIGFAARRRRSA